LPESLAQITRIALIVFQLTIDNWQMWCAQIGNCVAGFSGSSNKKIIVN